MCLLEPVAVPSRTRYWTDTAVAEGCESVTVKTAVRVPLSPSRMLASPIEMHDAEHDGSGPPCGSVAPARPAIVPSASSVERLQANTRARP